MAIAIDIPIRVHSEANRRDHWASKARRVKQHRATTAYYVGAARGKVSLPLTVTFTRLAPRELDDDNLASAFKAVRDGVADAFGVDDRDKRWRWQYRQERAKNYGIRIEMQEGVTA